MESGNPEILKRLENLERLKTSVAEVCRQYEEIVTSIFLIIGFPNESMSKILDTIAVAKEMDLDWCRTQVYSPCLTHLFIKRWWMQDLYRKMKKGRFMVRMVKQKIRMMTEESRSRPKKALRILA